ncbi:MAG: hypothetical protein VKN83_03335 [Cyanobacteriota bacterium]|jgi:hypothetical protein|nr:hypothetical protein [Cyanobacteriota bacterium]
MTFLPLLPTLRLGALCTSGLLALSTALTTAPSQAQTWGLPTYAPPPVGTRAPFPAPRPQAPYDRYAPYDRSSRYGDNTVYDNDPAAWALSEAQMAQRCNVGRLVGGLIGGGVGYATSRRDGRSWAVPLGALLGSQMGCNVGNGRGPVPW